MLLYEFKIKAKLNQYCKTKVYPNKGFPKFKKNCPAVEYKTSEWKLDDSRRC
jgi:hypothetical protein